MEEVVKQLTPLPFTGPDCPYALVQLNGDACHEPLPKEGHLSIQVIRGYQQQCLWKGQSTTGLPTPQLEFPGSLSSRTQWVWGPCDTLPTRANGQRSQPTQQQTYLPKGGHPTADHGGARTQSSNPQQSPSFYLDHKPCQASSTKVAEGEVSMTMEVRELLSWAALDTSEHASGSSTPKRQEPMVLVMPLPTKPEDFPKPVDTSSQVSTPNDAEMEDASLEEVPTPSSPTAEAPGPSSDAPPPDAAHLWEEANKALGDLLAIKSSIDALSVEVCFRVWHGPSWEWFQGYRVYQGSKGHLHAFYPGSWGLLFCSHQGGRSPKGLPGCFHSAVTPKSCSAPWRGIYWRGEKESTQLPLCLPDCLAG